MLVESNAFVNDRLYRIWPINENEIKYDQGHSCSPLNRNHMCAPYIPYSINRKLYFGVFELLIYLCCVFSRLVIQTRIFINQLFAICGLIWTIQRLNLAGRRRKRKKSTSHRLCVYLSAKSNCWLCIYLYSIHTFT